MTKYPPIGSVSYGTMLDRDLIPTFLDVLAEYAPATAAEITSEYEHVLTSLDDDDSDESPEYAGYLTSRLFDELDAIAPPYCRFGASEGNGADYGFWPDIDTLEYDASAHADVIKTNDTPEYIMHVSDHGNVTLYRVTLTEVWTIG